MTSGILVPVPGIEHRSSAVRVWNPNHWAARKVPGHIKSYRAILVD